MWDSINDLTIGCQNLNLLSQPNATLAPKARQRQARASGENLNYVTLAPKARQARLTGSDILVRSLRESFFRQKVQTFVIKLTECLEMWTGRLSAETILLYSTASLVSQVQLILISKVWCLAIWSGARGERLRKYLLLPNNICWKCWKWFGLFEKFSNNGNKKVVMWWRQPSQMLFIGLHLFNSSYSKWMWSINVETSSCLAFFLSLSWKWLQF